MWSFIFYICCFATSIFAATPVVDLTYAQYQGVPVLDPVNNESITQFLGIRYAAAPTGKVFTPALYRLSESLIIYSFTKKQEPWDSENLNFPRSRQVSNLRTTNHPSVFRLGPALLLKRHFVVLMLLFQTPALLLGGLRLVLVRVQRIAFSWSTSFFMLIDMCDSMLTTRVVLVFMFLVDWEKRRIFRLLSGYTGSTIYY